MSKRKALAGSLSYFCSSCLASFFNSGGPFYQGSSDWPSTPTGRREIHYNDPRNPSWFPMSNLSPYAITVIPFKFSKAAYVACKYESRSIKRELASCTDGYKALEIDLREMKRGKAGNDWHAINLDVTRALINLKVVQVSPRLTLQGVCMTIDDGGQNKEVSDTLKRSKGCHIEEDMRDAYWGTGADGKGENVRGQLWEEERDEPWGHSLRVKKGTAVLKAALLLG